MSTGQGPRAFISYSWDSEEHKAWVLGFAEALVKAGVHVMLDQWHLQPGQDAILFMEEAAINSDYVLVVCTPQYAAKANGRRGAAGYETTILTSSLVADLDTRKFIPILRTGRWGVGGSIPRWLAARDGIDLSADPYSPDNFEKLLRALHGKPLGPPPLGRVPNFETEQPPAAPSEMNSETSPTAFLSGLLNQTARDERLSPREQELLWNASRDSGGQIAHIKAIGGERLSVHNRTFPEQRDPRSKAEWFGALRSLVQRGLLEGVGPDPDYYRLTDAGWRATDDLSDFTVWDVTEITLERRYMGKTDPEILVLKCRRIVCIPTELYPDKMSVKEPKTLIIDGIDATALRSLPFEPTHVSFIDPESKSERWFCLYSGSEVLNRTIRLPIND